MLNVYPAASKGTAANAASRPTNFQRLKCSFSTRRANTTVTAGYRDVMSTASSRRPCWLAKMNNALAIMSKNPAIMPRPMRGRSSLSGAPITTTAAAVAVNEPMRERAAIQAGAPLA